jgi:hypothetical protein
MLDKLIQALAETKNEAADDVLLEALRLGSEQEKGMILAGLIRRKNVRGLTGVILQFDSLPAARKQDVLQSIGVFHPALRECGRSEDTSLRLLAMKLIALGHQGKLAYVLSENLHSSDEKLSKSAVDAMLGLAQWVAMETRALQKGVRGEAPENGRETSCVPVYFAC